MAEGFYGIGTGGLDGSEAHRNQGDADGQCSGGGEDPPADIGMVGEAVEPAMHGPCPQGKGDEGGDNGQEEKFARQQPDDAGGGGAKHFADADLAGTLFGGISDEAEETDAAD